MEINKLYTEGYHYAVELNLQQKGSKLQNTVRSEVQSTERYFYDQLLPTECNLITARGTATELQNSGIERRMVKLSAYDWADIIDNYDKLKFITEPTSVYALNAAYALGRAKDSVIVQAALGVAISGQEDSVEVALPDSQIIANNYHDDASNTEKCGLTIDKLRYAREILDDADVDDEEEQYCIVTSKQINNLLRTTEITSADYNVVRALVNGSVDTFMGFKFIRVSSNILPIDTNDDNNDRQVICYAKSGITFAYDNEITTNISVRNDMRMAIQVYASLAMGATRMDDKKVVLIQSFEA